MTRIDKIAEAKTERVTEDEDCPCRSRRAFYLGIHKAIDGEVSTGLEHELSLHRPWCPKHSQ